MVATSGNISGEPVLIDNAQAESDLGGIADGFLHHNRPILRPADDSVYRKSAGSLRPIRVGRGAAPVEFTLPWRQSRPTLAVGGHTKVTIALGWHDRVVVSPHIGDMDSPKSLATLERLSGDLQSLYGVTAERLVCDAHSGYTTHRWAQQQTGMPVTTVFPGI